MPKLTKLEAGYDPESSRGRRCGNCVYYGDLRCRLVEGTISPFRCCNLWRGKPSSSPFPDWLSGAEANRKLWDDPRGE